MDIRPMLVAALVLENESYCRFAHGVHFDPAEGAGNAQVISSVISKDIGSSSTHLQPTSQIIGHVSFADVL